MNSDKFIKDLTSAFVWSKELETVHGDRFRVYVSLLMVNMDILVGRSFSDKQKTCFANDILNKAISKLFTHKEIDMFNKYIFKKNES